ncbi:TPA: tetratricopeptide repeat protein [Legionella bozemanae]|uniref:Uncharacterized protein n=1 Tax=Legionella bozemanae TaxID=447 RepID=A0A0W0R9K5_LEGBO|nr:MULTISPECIES: hypothetical protein [Legionellaceae]KTC67720.1 hypothetical protein Lboz_3534 [Legionella bozemanae]MCW8485125.1 hypothetical protein [Fluoribacter dumoffii]STP13966.1 Uncharacterised protein [Legionella bozemanae]
MGKSEEVKLEKGMDSGPVNEKIKRQLFVSSIGICSAPNCNQRLTHSKTLLAECAHIIPRRIGGGPREDYITSLEDRSKLTNLIYLCEKHHTIIDDPEHENTYTADILRKWKQDHEDWAAKIKKSSPYLSSEFKQQFEDLTAKIAKEANIGEDIIKKLLDTCEQLLNSKLIDEARVFLSQIDILLLNSDNTTLINKAYFLDILLSINCEQILEAKKNLLQLIQESPLNIEAMLEYIEICENAPEPDDELVRIEKLARAIDNNHPHLRIIDLTRKLKDKNQLITVDEHDKPFAEDNWLNARLICLHSLLYNLNGELEQRDNLIIEWQKVLPRSPRPHLFKVLYKTEDQFRAKAQSKKSFIEALKFSENERKTIQAKNPLSLRDKIFWYLQEIKLNLGYINITCNDHEYNIENLNNIIKDLCLLINQCYFDNFIDFALTELLWNIQIIPDTLRLFIRKVFESKVLPSQQLLDSIFLQALPYEELKSDLEAFVKKYDYELLNILQAINNQDALQAAKYINKKNHLFSLTLLQSIIKHAISIQLISLLKFEDEYQQDFIYAKLKVLEYHKQNFEALDLISSLEINGASPLALSTIEKIAYRNEKWYLFIPPALKLLQLEISLEYKTSLHGKLAAAYFHQGDDTNAVVHAEYALYHHDKLDEENSCIILAILGNALLMKGEPDKACQYFAKYQHIKRSFPLLLEEAEIYLKSNLPDKYEKTLSLILKAFKEVDTYNDRTYQSSYALLIELSNANVILLRNEQNIEDECFVKLDGFQNGWFYIGEEEKNCLGAIHIKPGTANYNALIHKSLTEEIEWPAERFSSRNSKHKILHIALAPAFLHQRAHEAMATLAQLGSENVVAIQMINEEGKLDLENLNKFYEEQYSPGNKFFEMYIKSHLPFSFLCTMAGGLIPAINKIITEEKGFIRCNNGTQADIDNQKNTASEAIQGHPCFIEALSTLMLIEANLLEAVIKNLPNIGVSTSVIRFLRKIAASIEASSSSLGKGGFVKGSFEFRPKDEEKEEAFRNKLLQAANLLDKLPNKVVGKTHKKDKNTKNLDQVLPDYFVDAFRFAQENGAHILTDDTLFVQAYSILEKSLTPKLFSSLSVIRLLAENNKITWEEYLKYFSLLSHYRYHLLPFSVNDIIQAILPTTPGGLITPTSKNLTFFNLKLTLSLEYGVNDKVVFNILLSVFIKLLLDDSVTSELAEEIFKPLITGALLNRDKILAKALFQGCLQHIQNTNWFGLRIHQKLEILKNQLIRFSSETYPIIIEKPSLILPNLPTL